MEALAGEVILAVSALCKVIVEKVEEREDTHHVADIKVAHCAVGERHGVEEKFLFFYQPFDAEHEQRQEDQLIYPHGVVSLNDSIRRESVEGGECDGNDLSARVSGAEVQRHCKAAGTRLEHEHQQQRLGDEACRKEADNERKRAGEVVGKDAEKFTAESPRPRVLQAAAAEQLVSQFLEE